MKKTLEQQYKEETGLNAYEPNNMRPNIPEDVYVEWLEDKIEQLALCNVVGQSEQLCDLDGKTVRVKLKVTKHIPKIVIEDI